MMLPDDLKGVAGWYGKIACLGDFASRRLPTDFILHWDKWLQDVISGSRGHLGHAWLNAYLTSPVWHFVTFPGVVGEYAWAGVMMPSVDKVGRYFPLTIACALPALPSTENGLTLLDSWMERMEGLALSTLDTSRTAHQFDDAIVASPPPPALFVPTPKDSARRLLDGLRSDDIGLFPVPPTAEWPRTLGDMASLTFGDALRGASLWWAQGESGRNSQMMVCRNLPDPMRYIAMLRASGNV